MYARVAATGSTDPDAPVAAAGGGGRAGEVAASRSARSIRAQYQSPGGLHRGRGCARGPADRPRRASLARELLLARLEEITGRQQLQRVAAVVEIDREGGAADPELQRAALP